MKSFTFKPLWLSPSSGPSPHMARLRVMVTLPGVQAVLSFYNKPAPPYLGVVLSSFKFFIQKHSLNLQKQNFLHKASLKRFLNIMEVA